MLTISVSKLSLILKFSFNLVHGLSFICFKLQIIFFFSSSNSRTLTSIRSFKFTIFDGCGGFLSQVNSDSEITEVIIEDDGEGFSKDILDKIGEPYLRSKKINHKNKSGLGLGIFIGGTLLERNYAKITFRNSITRKGAEVIIKWNNQDLLEI